MSVLNIFSHALTFLEPIVLVADGKGFWVAMDWMGKDG